MIPIHPMIAKRRALLAVLFVSGSAVPAGAGCFDWLWGKSNSPSTAAATVPPTTITPLGPPVPVGPPTVTFPAGPVATTGATTVAPLGSTWNVQPGAQPGGVAVPSSAYSAGFGSYAVNPHTTYNSAAALQMPAYGQFPTAITRPIDNPSVLTGRPVTPTVAPSMTQPIVGQTAWGQPAWGQPAWGQTAVTPNSWAPQTSFNAAAAYQAAPLGTVPQTTIPTVMAQPPATAATTPGGFFGKIFGNQYQTQYNPVPTTVYRPVQQVDPITGQTTIVQQPCTTTLQQVQRSPYAALQPAPAPPVQPTYAGEANCGGEGMAYYPSQQQYVPQNQYAPQTQQYAPQTQYPSQPQYNPAQPQYNSAQPQYPAVQPTSGYDTNLPGSVAPAYGTQSGLPPSNGYTGPIPSGPFTSGPFTSGTETGSGYVGGGYTGTAPAPLQGSPSLGQPPAAGFGSGYAPSGPMSDQSPVGQPSLTAPPLARPNWDAVPSTDPLAQPPASQPYPALPSGYNDLPPIPAADGYRPPDWSASAPSWNDRTADTDQPAATATRYAGLYLGQPSAPSAVAQTAYQAAAPAAPVSKPRNSGGWHALP